MQHLPPLEQALAHWLAAHSETTFLAHLRISLGEPAAEHAHAEAQDWLHAVERFYRQYLHLDTDLPLGTEHPPALAPIGNEALASLLITVAHPPFVRLEPTSTIALHYCGLYLLRLIEISVPHLLAQPLADPTRRALTRRVALQSHALLSNLRNVMTDLLPTDSPELLLQQLAALLEPDDPQFFQEVAVGLHMSPAPDAQTLLPRVLARVVGNNTLDSQALLILYRGKHLRREVSRNILHTPASLMPQIMVQFWARLTPKGELSGTLLPWVAQFERAQRVDPMDDWVRQVPTHDLRRLLDPQVPPLAGLQALVGPPPITDNKALDVTLTQLLETGWPDLAKRLQRLDPPHDPIDWNQPLTLTQLRTLLQRLATDIIDPETTWSTLYLIPPLPHRLHLTQAILERHPNCTHDQALTTATLCYGQSAETPLVAPYHLSTLELAPRVPAFSDWYPESPDHFLEILGITQLWDTSTGRLTCSAAQCWAELCNDPNWHRLTRALLIQLGWIDEPEIALPTSAAVDQALVARSLLAHCLGRMPIDDLDSPHWGKDQTFAEVNQALKTRIARHLQDAHPATRELVTHLWLRDHDPVLLVRDIPDALPYASSLQSVALLHGAALLEAVRPGGCAETSFDELVLLPAHLAAQQDVALAQHWTTTLVVPALRFALAHNASDHQGALSAASGAHAQAALDFYKQRQTEQQNALQALMAPVPDRRDIARAMLDEAGIDRPTQDKPITLWSDWINHPLLTLARAAEPVVSALLKPPTLLEHVMMGDLTPRSGPSAPARFEQAFSDWRHAFSEAKTCVILRLLETLPAPERSRLETSFVTLCSVAFDAAKGEHGLILSVSDPNRQHFYYQLIPAAGHIHRLPGKPDMLDSDAFLSGTPARNSLAPTHPLKASLENHGTLNAPHLKVIAQHCSAMLLDRHFEALLALHRGQTHWEHLEAAERRIFDTLLRLVVPFYGCIKDLSDGDHSAGVIAGCVLDAVFTLVPAGRFMGASLQIGRLAGRISVRATTELMGQALVELGEALIKQSTVFALHDNVRLVAWLIKGGWRELIAALPKVARLLQQGLKTCRQGASSAGLLRMSKALGKHWLYGGGLARQLRNVDGIAEVPVIALSSQGLDVLRLVDPHDGGIYGPRLYQHDGALHTGRGAVTPAASGARYVVHTDAQDELKLEIAPGSQAHAITSPQGELRVRVDDTAFDILPRHQHLYLEQAPSSASLEVLESVCRIKRDLEPAPCVAGIRLQLPQRPVTEGLQPGEIFSEAFRGREFYPARPSTNAPELFVYKGRFVDRQEKVLGKQALKRWRLPLTVEFRAQVPGRRVPDSRLGLQGLETLGDRAAFMLAETDLSMPIVELDGLTAALADRRRLRALPVLIKGTEHLMVEAEEKVFYAAARPAHQASDLTFQRVQDPAAIAAYLEVSEPLRLAASHPGFAEEADKLARLLYERAIHFDENPDWLRPNPSLQDYSGYKLSLARAHEDNPLLNHARRIMTDETAQTRFFDLMTETLPDWEDYYVRSVDEQERIVEILNALLPIEGSEGWPTLSVKGLEQPSVHQALNAHLRKANLAFFELIDREGNREIIYAASYSKDRGHLRFQPQSTGERQVPGGGAFTDIDAPAIVGHPDPDLLSLPVVRHGQHVTISVRTRNTDSERLLATWLRRYRRTVDYKAINIFTRLNTCRTCGSIVLPQLAFDYPNTRFAITYLQNYPH